MISDLNMNFDDPDDRFQVYDWVEAGDIEQIHTLLNEHKMPADIEIDEEGNTPLIIAAYYGHLDIVKLLVNAGADVNYSTPSGDTPLKSALQDGALDVAAYLAPLTEPEMVEYLRERYFDEDW
jgi:ankyrin repeat protein